MSSQSLKHTGVAKIQLDKTQLTSKPCLPCPFAWHGNTNPNGALTAIYCTRTVTCQIQKKDPNTRSSPSTLVCNLTSNLMRLVVHYNQGAGIKKWYGSIGMGLGTCINMGGTFTGSGEGNSSGIQATWCITSGCLKPYFNPSNEGLFSTVLVLLGCLLIWMT